MRDTWKLSIISACVDRDKNNPANGFYAISLICL